jgi:hypothetical protein
MRAAGELNDPDRALIGDAGASKREVSVVNSTDDGVREVRTVGSDPIEGDDLSPAARGVEVTDSMMRANLTSAVESDLAQRSDRRAVVPDLENVPRQLRLLVTRLARSSGPWRNGHCGHSDVTAIQGSSCSMSALINSSLPKSAGRGFVQS